MAFSVQTIIDAWKRAAGLCECIRLSHFHINGRCAAVLVPEYRGVRGMQGAWEANHRNRVESGGDDSFSNCEILCWACHRETF